MGNLLRATLSPYTIAATLRPADPAAAAALAAVGGGGLRGTTVVRTAAARATFTDLTVAAAGMFALVLAQPGGSLAPAVSAFFTIAPARRPASASGHSQRGRSPVRHSPCSLWQRP